MEDSVDTPKDEQALLLDRLIGYYTDSENNSQDARRASERDRDYYDHKQLTAEERAELKARGQPEIIINRIKPKVDFLLGMERQMRTDVKAFPRTPEHEEGAEAATDSLRYVMDNNDFDYKRSAVFESIILEGTGGVEVLMREGKDGLEVDIQQYPWDRLFWDVHSRRRDFSDAKYKGAIVWMDTEDAKLLASDQGKEAIDLALGDNSMDTTGNESFDDAPRISWVDSKRDRVRICSIWHKYQGQWHWAMFTGTGFVQPDRVSPFIDDQGQPECGLELESAFVDRDGNRYGAARTWIDPQDEINKRRSKALHLLTMRQTLGEKGATTKSIDYVKKQLAKPDGHVEIVPGMRFELLNTMDMAQGQLGLLQEAKEEIDAVGANAALQGKEDRVMSGRALESRQQSGAMELGPVFDGLRHWQKRVYRQCWNRVKQYWDQERWIRVTDDEKNLKFVGLNRPVTMGEQLESELGPIPPQFASDPRLQMQVDTENNIAELDVDIVLEDAPDTVTIQGEQFDMLAQMYQANPQRPDNPEGIPWKMVIEASSLRNKDKLLGDDEEEPTEEQQQAQQQAQEAQQEVIAIQKADAIAKVQNAEAKAQKTAAETEKIRKEIERGPEPPAPIDTTDADLKRYEIDVNAMRDIRLKELEVQAAEFTASNQPSEKEDAGDVNVILGGGKRIVIDRENGEITGAQVVPE